MQADLRVAGGRAAGAAAGRVDAHRLVEPAEIGVTVLKAYRQRLTNHGFDARAPGQAGPGGSPRAAAGCRREPDAIDFVGRIAERPADTAEGNANRSVSQCRRRHEKACAGANRGIPALADRSVEAFGAI